MIRVRSVSKRFGAFEALRGASLDIEEGELVALLGPSGSGKTTLLRVLAGLEAPDAGEVHFGGADVTHVPAAERRVGFVFQHYALFRHLSVFENVAFGLRVMPRASRPSEAAIRARVGQLLERVRLSGLEQRRPAELSGGQRQRVALARALAIEPRVLLLDEPFGALDARVREELRAWLRELHEQMPVTTLLVTHDQEEAMGVADRVAVMREGRVEQIGSPEELEDAPASRFVADFVGHANVVRGSIREGRLDLGAYALDVPAPLGQGAAALAYVRAYDIDLSRDASPPALSVAVRSVRRSGAVVRIDVDAGVSVGVLRVELARDLAGALDPRPGEQLFARIRRARVASTEGAQR